MGVHNLFLGAFWARRGCDLWWRLCIFKLFWRIPLELSPRTVNQLFTQFTVSKSPGIFISSPKIELGVPDFDCIQGALLEQSSSRWCAGLPCRQRFLIVWAGAAHWLRESRWNRKLQNRRVRHLTLFTQGIINGSKYRNIQRGWVTSPSPITAQWVRAIRPHQVQRAQDHNKSQTNVSRNLFILLLIRSCTALFLPSFDRLSTNKD